MQKLRCSPAETSNSATGSRVFCVRPPWVSCVARCSGQLLRDAAAAAPNPALFFISSSFPLLLFAITTTGAPHTQSFYTVETTWGFPPTGRKIKIIEPRCLQTADTPGFYYGNATGAEVACFLLPLKWFLILFGVEWNDLLIHTSFICK